MKLHTFPFLLAVFLLGCNTLATQKPFPEANIVTEKEKVPGKEVMYGHSGICGIFEDQGFRVTRTLPQSPAHGRVKKGDFIEKVWKYGFGDMGKKGLHRSREDFWGTMKLTVQRPNTFKKTPDTLSLYLTLPPLPGEVYNFGPTGFHGALHPNHLVVTKIIEGSPAEASLKVGDKIIAVADQPLQGKILEQFAEAIDLAESERGKGELRLKVEQHQESSKATTSQDVVLKLNVFGTYSDTAPYDCPKTDALITQAADRILERKKYGRLNIHLLGLLATGEKKYIDHVGQVLKNTRSSKKLNMYGMGSAWHYSYRLVTLCEYFLLTQDKSVLPMIEELAVVCAEGQDAAGLWNHRGANPEANFGKKHGRLYGYGAINQTSIVMWIGLTLTQKCGIKHPEIDMAVEKTYRLYENWIGKGALPYGNHGPNEGTNNNNGTSGSVAVGFSLMGNQKGVRYYSMLSAASHPTLMTGHANCSFNPLWSALGAHLAGPEVTAAYFKETKWLNTITRTHDGDYYEQLQSKVGGLDGLGWAGSALLHLSQGRRAIYITGKDMDTSLWVKDQEATKMVEQADSKVYELSDEDLITQLGSPLPQRRLRAAEEIKFRNINLTPRLEILMKSGTRDEKIGACMAAQIMKLSPLAQPIFNLVNNPKEDIWVREKAARALGVMGESAQAFVPQLLQLIAEDQPNDPFRDFDKSLGFAVAELSPEPMLLTDDRKLFYAAVRKLLDHKHMNGRQAGMNMIRSIPPEDFHEVADLTRHILEDKDLSYTAYQGMGAMAEALKIWARLDIAEGVDHALAPLDRAVGRGGFKNRMLMEVLPHFAGHAKPALPRLKTMNTRGRFMEPWQAMIQSIESAPKPEKVLTFEEAKETRRPKN